MSILNSSRVPLNLEEEFLKLIEREIAMEKKAEAEFTPEERLKIYTLKSAAAQSHVSMKLSFNPLKISTENIVLAGGFFASVFHGEPVRDYDLFVLDNGRQSEFAGYLAGSEKLVIKDCQYTANPNIKQIWHCEEKKVQFIFSKFNNLKDLMDDFDFKHTRVAYDGDKLFISRSAYDAISSKTLLIHNEERKTNKQYLQYRIKKFVGRGWNASNIV